MSLTRKIAHNTAIQFAGKIFGTLLALVTISMILRYLGREGFGQYSTAINFLSVFAILIDLGLYLIVTREISMDDANESKLISNTITFRLAIGFVILSVAPIIGLLMPYAEITKWAILINASAFMFMSLNQILTGLFQKYLRMDKVAIAEVVGRAFWLLAVYYSVNADLGLLWIVGTNSIAALLHLVVLFLFSRKYTKIIIAFDFPIWKKIWKSAAPLAVNVVLNLVYFKAGMIILTLVDTEEAVGVLGAAQKILENLITFSAIFAGLLFPIFSRYVNKDPEQFRRVFQKGFDVLSIIVFPLVFGTILLAKEIVVFFGGEDFVEAAPVLQLLMVAVGAIFFGNLFGNAIVAADLQKKIVPVYIVNALIAVGLSWVLIPHISFYGAAISTLATEVIVTTASGYFVYKYLKTHPSLLVFGKALLATLTMVGGILILPQGLNVFFLVVIGAAIYSLTLLLLGGVSVKMLREIMSLKKV